MKFCKIILVAASVLVLGSCSTPKQISYFQDLRPGESELTLAAPTEIKIQPKDKLSILINSQDLRLTNLFNLSIVSQQVGMENTTSQNRGLSGYTVDSKGNIDFPVLGALHVQDMTREEVAAYIKKELQSHDLIKDPVVTVEFMNELVRGYSESHSVTPYGRIPSNLLWFDPRKGSEKYIWYNPPQKRMMFFHDILKIESAEYNLPGVIYEAGENRLNVYAYTDVELTDNSDLFAAPFFNVTGASVCLGSAKIEKPKDLTYTNLLEYWEKRFWLTEFSHLGGGGNPTKSNLVLVTKAAKDKPFDLDELQPLKKLKLKDILR